MLLFLASSNHPSSNQILCNSELPDGGRSSIYRVVVINRLCNVGPGSDRRWG